MMLVKNMVNGTTIYQDMDCNKVEYYHLEFDKHRAIVANGVLTESYLDVGNMRNIFE
jgi:antigen 43